MSAIKDILEKIDKLSPTDQERLKTILLSKSFTTSMKIKDFVTKERFANGRVCLAHKILDSPKIWLTKSLSAALQKRRNLFCYILQG